MLTKGGNALRMGLLVRITPCRWIYN